MATVLYRSELIAYVYCHRNENKLCIIPMGVMDIILSYYHSMETWDASIHKQLQNDKYLRLVDGEEGRMFG